MIKNTMTIQLLSRKRTCSQKKVSHSSWPVWATIAALLVSVFFQGGCATIKEKKLEKEGLTLIYRHKSQAGPAFDKLRLNHPVKISEDDFRNHLYSLQYEELSLLGKKKYTISLTDLKDTTKILTKAVNRMAPENILVFELETSRGRTVGEIFKTENNLNFRFHSIKGVEFSSASFGGGGGTSWRMVPVSGQRYRVTKKLLGTSTQENWIVAKMVLPKISRRLSKEQGSKVSKPPTSQMPTPSAPINPPVGNNQELEKKLQFLKDLRDKDLIDDGEYEIKRKELLDSFL
jgi:hypothetical protein